MKADALDLSTKTWAPRAAMLEARGWLNAVVGKDGRIYAIGGSPPSPMPSNFPPPTAKLMVYSPPADKWSW